MNETKILDSGGPLSSQEISDAQSIGVESPGKVRLLRVRAIPQPEHPVLQKAIAITGLLSPLTAGLTLRYGIFIRSDCWNNRSLIFHELVHTHQYERHGGINSFLRQYLTECLTLGYDNSPLEQEAVSATNQFLH